MKESKPEIEVELRPTRVEDLEHLFQFQLDEEATVMAAFTPAQRTDKSAFLSKYSKLLDEPTVNMKTILLNDNIIGSISKFELEGKAELTYWIDRKFWGKGIATIALQKLLADEPARPIYGRTAFDNIASQKVLEKCGFHKIGTDKGFANARQTEIEEFIYELRS